MALIFTLSSIPGDVEDERSMLFSLLHPSLQNLLHVPLYGTLQFLWLRSFFKHGKKDIIIVLICLGITMGYGVFDEVHQTFVPGRYGSMLDMLLNVIGTGAGTVLFLISHRISQSARINN